MDYSIPHRLTGPFGNNDFGYSIDHDAKIIIPSIRDGSFSDITLGDETVFSIEEKGKKKVFSGLACFIRTRYLSIPCIICDNHNHALYFWYEAYFSGNIEYGIELVHIDEHSDLWENENTLGIYTRSTPKDDARSLDEIWKFTNYSCNVGNYIVPARNNGFIQTMIRIEGEEDMKRCEMYEPGNNMVMNLDLDFFSSDLEYIDFKKKKHCILRFAEKAKCITIATSPAFIDQEHALRVLHDVFMSDAETRKKGNMLRKKGTIFKR